MQIVKVLHGADKDIQWLQRDFGLYMANMFDTGQASRVLEYSGHGLGYLLHHFCQVKVSLLSGPALPCPALLCPVNPHPPAPSLPIARAQQMYKFSCHPFLLMFHPSPLCKAIISIVVAQVAVCLCRVTRSISWLTGGCGPYLKS